ncbi:MAG TPA: hydrogenase 4 subunit B [Anaerolineales bacterium]|nr:hydrogenase 4 subunit B [Anaerolineales bacterium]
MNAIQLLLLSVLIFGLGAFVSLCLSGLKSAARIASGSIGAVGSVLGIIAAVRAVVAIPIPLNLASQLPFGNFSLEMDGLSALMVGIISVVSLATSIYSISYLGHYTTRELGILGFFANLFAAMMLLVVTVSNAFYFLIFWEMMTLASYFLVIFEGEKKESIQAGYLYMLVAHAGTALIMLAFFIFYSSTGSFDFAAFRQAQLPPVLRDLVFLLSFIGFGAKAGVVPLHIWLPRAHPAAPSHISALLSGVMIKTAIYGILRVCVDLLGPSFLWWAIVVLVFGAVSAVLGVLYALAEHDIKRVLAYSSVENIGIILLGIGTGMVGLATHQPLVAVLGFLAALYHTLNHAFFKSLLFLGAGAVDYRLHNRNLNDMGGLGKLMPWTGLTFLIGALAIAAIPPFNGFVSEWFTYQAFFAGSGNQEVAVRAALPLCAMILALTGALAAMVAIKTYGGAFAGPARTKQASQALEVPGTMLIGMIFLAIGCIVLGIGAPFIAPNIADVVTRTLNASPVSVAQATWVFPISSGQAWLSTPFILILLIGLLVVPLVLVAVYHGYEAGRRVVKDPWACGYGYSSRMSVSSSNFDQPVAVTFGGIYWLRPAIQRPMDAVVTWSRRVRETFLRMEPGIENMIKQPTTRAVEYLGQQIQALQMGDVRMYCFYIILTLAILLVVIFK